MAYHQYIDVCSIAFVDLYSAKSSYNINVYNCDTQVTKYKCNTYPTRCSRHMSLPFAGNGFGK